MQEDAYNSYLLIRFWRLICLAQRICGLGEISCVHTDATFDVFLSGKLYNGEMLEILDSGTSSNNTI